MRKSKKENKQKTVELSDDDLEKVHGGNIDLQNALLSTSTRSAVGGASKAKATHLSVDGNTLDGRFANGDAPDK